MNGAFESARQLLPKACYLSDNWFEQEKLQLFDQCWVFAATIDQLENPGDYVTIQYLNHPLFVIRDDRGQLKAFHNICRHLGCEVLEANGNTGTTIVCPYHRWTYQMDGALRGVPNEADLFEGLDRESLGLHPATAGEYAGIVFVNPSPDPAQRFESFIANMNDHLWPHDFNNGSMNYAGSVVYEMQCNWKVFYENAIDGYHLGYLHEQTLGKVYPDKNIWYPVGRNQVWYSTERGEPQAKTVLSDEYAGDAECVPGLSAEEAYYPGVVMLFPLTILSPNPWGFYISVLEPKSPDLTYMTTHAWSPAGSGSRLGDRLGKPEPVRIRELKTHPLESGDFQIEDMWIVEKIQRTLKSPHYQVGPLADGPGAEQPLTHFQRSVLDFVKN